MDLHSTGGGIIMSKNQQQQAKATYVEPNRSRKRKQFTLSDSTRDQLDYLKKFHGTSESVIVDMAIDHYFEYVKQHKKPLRESD